jgi:UDP-N-acetylglucosamine/UDP-N-acetylgalactosamine 4-epimerase
MIRGDELRINGTGETSRDFCYVANVVQANLLAATTTRQEALGEAYNIALGLRTTLLQLFEALRSRLAARKPELDDARPVHGPFRAGDVRHSLADIGKARRLLGYEPSHTLDQGLDEAIDWYIRNLS